MLAFHRGLAMVAEIGMFFALGLLVFPSQFGSIAVKAVLLALIRALIARPIASTVATVRQGFSRPERTLLAVAGLRGAVPVILATFAVIDGVPRATELLNIVFFVVLLSAALQGAAVQALAARLRPDGAERRGRAPSAGPGRSRGLAAACPLRRAEAALGASSRGDVRAHAGALADERGGREPPRREEWTPR